MGAGIVMDREKSGIEEAPILQFTTLVIQNKDVAHAGAQRLRRSLSGLRERQYAEFINSIDVNNQRFTIERVFSNNVCPAGQKLGSTISAEQLFAPIWEKGSSGLGEVLPIHRIKEIKLSDVVNWNTYAVLCTALFERGEHYNMFGDHFKVSLDEELRIAKLTRSTCKSLSMVQVFTQTILGKFTLCIIDQWKEKTSVCVKITDVNVSFREYDKEFIAGEERDVMDVICKVQVEYAESLWVPTLSMSSNQSVISLEAVPIDPDGEVEKTPFYRCCSESSSLSARTALEQWMRRMRVSHSCKDWVNQEHDWVNDGGTNLEHRSALIALVTGIEALQEERGSSCLAVAEGIDEHMTNPLKEQREITDAAFVQALELTTSPIVRSISGSLILLRVSVDTTIGDDEWSWEDRYKHICAGLGGFNNLIGILVECLIDACNMNSEIPDTSVESIGLFSYFAEQLGRERAFVLCHGRSKAVDPLKEKHGMHKVVQMSATRTLIGDMLKIDTRFETVLHQLDKAELDFLADDDHDAKNWFRLISNCKGLLWNLVRSLIDDQSVPMDTNFPLKLDTDACRDPAILRKLTDTSTETEIISI
jgi:hypothetical protein